MNNGDNISNYSKVYRTRYRCQTNLYFGDLEANQHHRDGATREARESDRHTVHYYRASSDHNFLWLLKIRCSKKCSFVCNLYVLILHRRSSSIHRCYRSEKAHIEGTVTTSLAHFTRIYSSSGVHSRLHYALKMAYLQREIWLKTILVVKPAVSARVPDVVCSGELAGL